MRRRAQASVARAGLCAAALASLALAGPAAGDVFGPIDLVSKGPAEQAGYADDTAISAGGRYVAFDGSYAGQTGVWRRDLAGGAVQKVAGGDALLPSISADGQYVSFTTRLRLAPNDDVNAAPDVYVRNMALPEALQESQACVEEEREEASAAVHGQSCPFTLVSAAGGRAAGLSYEGEERYGAVASGRVAISADGRRVAFITTAKSNLAGEATPARQVAVRDTQTDATTLVSVRADPATGQPLVDPETGGPEPVPGSEQSPGALYAATGMQFPPVQYGNFNFTEPLGAAISADGSTVAWMGVNIGEQARVLASEAGPGPLSEPLWRRIADGPGTPTRRITGGSDPESAACATSAETVLAQTPTLADPCQGPFFEAPAELSAGIWKGLDANFVPQLSADGYTVAFLAQATPVSRFAGFGSNLETADDVYLADMRPAPTRVQALSELTEIASGNGADLATTGPIVDLAISPDGRQVAFSTQRTLFPLGSPAFVSAPAALPGMTELFDADLANQTLTRVTHSFLGEAPEHPHQETGSTQTAYERGDGSVSPSFSADGNLLAFASTASDLVYGDGNTRPLVNGKLEKTTVFDGSDAFLVARIPFVATPTEDYVSGAPAQAALAPEWRLGVTAVSLANGQVRLYVTVPGAGRLGASAASRLRAANSAKAKGGSRHGRRRPSYVRRTVASAKAAVSSGEGGLQTLTLTLGPGYRRLASARAGLGASVLVSFAAPGHRTLSQSVAVTFKRRAAKARRSSRRGKAR